MINHNASHGIESKYFLLMTIGVMKVANHMITCVAAGINHKKATTLSVSFPCSSWAHYFFSITGYTYLGYPSCEAIIFIFVVELQFLLYV
jgi:hypothetical protein